MKKWREEISKEMKPVIDYFNDFEIIDMDNSTAYLRKKEVGVIDIRVLSGSLGSYAYEFIVEKFGYRSKIFSGKNAMERIRNYLQTNSVKQVKISKHLRKGRVVRQHKRRKPRKKVRF